MISNVNTTIALVLKLLEKLGVTKARANQAPDKFDSTAESDFKNARIFLPINII